MVCLLRQTMTRLFLDAAHKPYFLWYYWPLSVLIIWIILQNPHFIQALWIFSLVQKTQSELICWHSLPSRILPWALTYFFFQGVEVIINSNKLQEWQKVCVLKVKTPKHVLQMFTRPWLRVGVSISNSVTARLSFWFTCCWNSGATLSSCKLHVKIWLQGCS